MEYQFGELGRILRKYSEDPLSLLISERHIYYTKAVKGEGGKVVYEYEPKRIIRFQIDTQTMTAQFDASEEMTSHTIADIKYLGNGLGRTSKKCAPYYAATKFWEAHFFKRDFFSDVLCWRQTDEVFLYRPETMEKIELIQERFPFSSLDVLGSLQSFGITDTDKDKIGLVLLEIDSVPLYRDEVFQQAFLSLITNFKDENMSNEYTCAITNRQGVPLSNDTGKTVMKFFTQTDPYHFQFQATLKKEDMHNFLLSEEAQLEYMIGSKFVENYLSLYPLIRHMPDVDAAYLIPSFEEPLQEEEEELVYHILMNHVGEHRNTKGIKGFDIPKLIEWQQVFRDMVEHTNVTFDLLFLTTPSGAFKVVRHYAKIDFHAIKQFRVTFNAEIDRLAAFNRGRPSIRKPKLEDILCFKSSSHSSFVNQLLECALYGDRMIRESSFWFHSIQLIEEATNDLHKELIKKKEKAILEKVLFYRDSLIFMLDAMYRTLCRHDLITGGLNMESNSTVLTLMGEPSIYNKKYDDYADMSHLRDTERAFLYIGGVIRNVFEIETKRGINPTQFNTRSLHATNVKVLLAQLFERLHLFEREGYDGYYGSYLSLLERGSLLLGNPEQTLKDLSPYHIAHCLYLGSAIANLYIHVDKPEKKESAVEKATKAKSKKGKEMSQ